MHLAPVAPSLRGSDHELVGSGYVAHVSSIGASLRSLQFESRDLIVPFAEHEVRPAYRGAILAPWPNRVADGRYVFDEVVQSLEINEPSRGHALHGLVSWLDFRTVWRDHAAVELSAIIRPVKGYPHTVEIRVRYDLDHRGLSTRVTGLNLGSSDAPFGMAAHPYLRAGEGCLDDHVLELPASLMMRVSDRLVPLTTVSVDDPSHGDFDFRSPRRLGDVRIDHAFTDFDFRSGRVEARLTTADGSGVAMRWDAACPWVQVHTADLPGHEATRLGLAVEPMTCPPDAFNTGKDLIRLRPGQTATADWTITALQAWTD